MALLASTAQRRASRSAGESTVYYNGDSSRKRRKYIPGDFGDWEQFIERKEMAGQSRSSGRLASDAIGSPGAASRPRREAPPPQPTYSSAAAAAAAAQGDGYKPREERGWEEFHPELDIEGKITVFSAEEIDGIASGELHSPVGQLSPRPADIVAPAASPSREETGHHFSRSQVNGDHSDAPLTGTEAAAQDTNLFIQSSPHKRRPGRPPRRPESMLSGLGSPPAPKIVPIPAQNPRERLNLPKPSFRQVRTFLSYETDPEVQVNYVDRTMAHVGFQESEEFVRPEKKLIRLDEMPLEEDVASGLSLESDGVKDAAITSATVLKVEYDMDEQDLQWLDGYNSYRKKAQLAAIKPGIFEITMTQIEKEWHALEKRIPKPNPKPPQTHRPRSSSAAAVNGEPTGTGEEQDTKCAICDDGDCENTNAIVFCDGCDLAVHQECYGVPFIPEGQWLCRKCQLIGRGTPTCIFCPNVEGAFKLTHESRWAHLLCAIWIPEVSLGNITFMEPVMDVAKVPKQRWKLNCYICNQKMGACIQCGNRNCFQAFHVTCARRAKLFLKMKSAHGAPASLDASVLKAFCDKHVPSEWRREHDVDRATANAKSFYRRTMRHRKWADSQQSALAMVPTQHFGAADIIDPQVGAESNQVNALSGQKRKRDGQDNIWRMPSGAPIVPKVVLDAVETSLQRFSVSKRKEFAAEACKYWTLKREARRGAALLKRLQLQMETFSSSEISRRDFTAMGAAGRPRLLRRIEFASYLMKEMIKLKKISEKVRDREAAKLKDAELLRDVIDNVYFPIPRLLWPVLRKAQHLDPKGIFSGGFKSLQGKLEDRHYTSVGPFSLELGSVFQSVLEQDTANEEAAQSASQLDETAFEAAVAATITDHKEAKRLAKRITKAIQQPLEEATRKEAELGGRPFEKEVRNLEAILNRSIGLRPSGEAINGGEDSEAHLDYKRNRDAASRDSQKKKHTATELTPDKLTDIKMANGVDADHEDRESGGSSVAGDTTKSERLSTPVASIQEPNGLDVAIVVAPTAPLTPPTSEKDLLAPLTHGGVPWYLEPFDPIGTTVHEERWTGREVLRGMSEELSDLDEETLKGMGPETMEVISPVVDKAPSADNPVGPKSAPKKARRKNRGW